MVKALWGVALLGGGLYWASRQPGGISGPWERLRRAVSDIRNGEDPMAAGRRFVAGETAAPALNDPALQSGGGVCEGVTGPGPHPGRVSAHPHLCGPPPVVGTAPPVPAVHALWLSPSAA